MKKIFVVLLCLITATAAGLYFRPSYTLIGQLDWVNVITKGYFVGSFVGFFSQGYIDESFWFVMRFTAGGLVAGVGLVMLSGGSSKGSSSKKKKS